MAIIANLTAFQQTELETVLTGFQETNPNVLFKFFNQTETVSLSKLLQKPNYVLPPVKEGDFDTKETNQNLEDKIDALNRRLDLIFGNHILVEGKMVDINSLKK